MEETIEKIPEAEAEMPEQKFDKQTVWVICANCGHQRRNHRVLHEKVNSYCDDPHEPEVRREYHRFVECMGNAELSSCSGWPVTTSSGEKKSEKCRPMTSLE